MKISNLNKYRGGMTAIVGLSAILGLTACGGGGGNDTGATTTTSDISQTTVGAVTGFGSVFVNGIEFDTSNAQIHVEDNSASESDLAVGMMVTVKGSHDDSSGTAVSIHADDEIEGVVVSNSIASGQQSGEMNVMGQTVQVKTTTSFESYVAGIISVDQITSGNVVEVNGYSDGNGLVIATRIEVKSKDLNSYLSLHDYIELKGVIADLDNVDPSIPKAFHIGELVVDYSGAIIDDGYTLSNGLFVEVKSQQALQGGVLVASKVEVENNGSMGYRDDHDDEGDEVKIKGAITKAIEDGILAVDATEVIVNAGTKLEHITTDGLVVGTLVEVEAYYNGDGDLVAEEIEAQDDSDVEVKGVIAEIETSGTNTGTITLQSGDIIYVDNDTIMKDERDEGMIPVKHFNLTNLAIGDFIETYVVPVDTGEYRAVKLKRDDI